MQLFYIMLQNNSNTPKTTHLIAWKHFQIAAKFVDLHTLQTLVYFYWLYEYKQRQCSTVIQSVINWLDKDSFCSFATEQTVQTFSLQRYWINCSGGGDTAVVWSRTVWLPMETGCKCLLMMSVLLESWKLSRWPDLGLMEHAFQLLNTKLDAERPTDKQQLKPLLPAVKAVINSKVLLPKY